MLLLLFVLSGLCNQWVGSLLLLHITEVTATGTGWCVSGSVPSPSLQLVLCYMMRAALPPNSTLL